VELSKEQISKMNEQIVELGVAFGLRCAALRISPKSAKWKSEQIAFIVGAAQTAQILGDEPLTWALGMRTALLAQFGDNAFVVKEV
jgi:hypothetical protein